MDLKDHVDGSLDILGVCERMLREEKVLMATFKPQRPKALAFVKKEASLA